MINLPFLLTFVPPIFSHCNSQVIITKAKSKKFNEKRRYLTIRHKFIEYMIFYDIIILDFIRFENNIMDPQINGLVFHQIL